LFPAFDFDQMAQLNADMYVCLLDRVEALHARLERDHQINHSLKDLLVWREEETLATEMMMLGSSYHSQANMDHPRLLPDTAADRPRFYIMAIGEEQSTAEMFYRLMMQPFMPKAYLSFPMTHIADMPDILAEVEQFRAAFKQHFIIFDPGNLEEHDLYQQAVIASQNGEKVIETEVVGQRCRFDVAEILQVAGDIHGQIYARDFMLIEQADMIISYIPELPNGKPGLSSGVERELQHAHEATREVYLVWKPKVALSPFVTETATEIFPDTAQALQYFQQKGYITKP
jgi:adenylate kinase